MERTNFFYGDTQYGQTYRTRLMANNDQGYLWNWKWIRPTFKTEDSVLIALTDYINPFYVESFLFDICK